MAIKRIAEYLKPASGSYRACPRRRIERGQWYYQRYTAHLPAKGDIFDRSWSRRGVEKVMGLPPQEYVLLLWQTPDFRAELNRWILPLANTGFQSQTPNVVAPHSAARRNDPVRQWKLSLMDLNHVSVGGLFARKVTR